MKKEIILCDDCQKKVAETKCAICQKDLCLTCTKKVSWQIRNVGTEVDITLFSADSIKETELQICRGCFRLPQKIPKDQLRKIIIKLKDIAIAEAL